MLVHMFVVLACNGQSRSRIAFSILRKKRLVIPDRKTALGCQRILILRSSGAGRASKLGLFPHLSPSRAALVFYTAQSCVGFHRTATKERQVMRKHLLRIAVVCAACAVAGAQAQSSASSQPGSEGASAATSSQQPGSYRTSGSQSGWQSQAGATGRMSHKDIRASQLTGAQVTSNSGTQVGTISDCIINPASGRIEFAILSVSSSGSAGSSSATTPGSATGKQVAVPWMLLRSSSTSSSSTAGQESFEFVGNSSKLDSAPTFDPNTDLTQPNWRQSVYSYFGMSHGGMATGGATSPGSSAEGSGPESSGASSSPGSSSAGSSSSSPQK